MANDLHAVVPQLLAQALGTLREKAFMPRLVNRAYDPIAGEKGSTIDIPIPSAVAVVDVAPANLAPNPGDTTPTLVSVPMNNWKEAAFQLTDKDIMEVREGTIPMQAQEAIKAIANNINVAILARYVDFFGFYGTPGTTPFASSVVAATQVRKILNVQLAPEDDRRLVLDPEAEANALGLDAISNQVWRNGLNPAAIVDGQISRTMGFDWFSHQLVPTHTAGTGAGYLVNNGAGYAIGATTVAVDTGTGTMIVGDVFTFAGQTQTYVVTVALAANSVSFYPPLKAAVADNAAITSKASHTVNLAFHRDAIAFASRPLASVDHPASIVETANDPLSGLVLRLGVSREFKRTRWSFDVLYGVKTVRPELGARLAG